MSHHWPFLSYSIRDIAPNKITQACLGFSRKGRGQNHDDPQCAGLAIHNRVSLLVVTPNLRGVNAIKRANRIPSGGSNPGETALNERARSPTDSSRDTGHIPKW